MAQTPTRRPKTTSAKAAWSDDIATGASLPRSTDIG